MAVSYIEMCVVPTSKTKNCNVDIVGDSNNRQTHVANGQNHEIAGCDQGHDVEGQTPYKDEKDNPPLLVT